MKSLPFLKYSLIALLLLTQVSCHKTGTAFTTDSTTFSQFNLNFPGSTSSILLVDHFVLIKVPGEVTSAQEAVADFSLPSGARASIHGVPQESGHTVNNFEQDLIYNVDAGSFHEDWLVVATNNDSTMSQGLGHFVQRSAHNDRPYSWYIDQLQTGRYNLINCGPSSAAMACHWSDSTFTGSAEDARARYQPDSVWWTTSSVESYLAQYQTPFATLAFPNTESGTTEAFAEQLDKGRILICLADMNYVHTAAENSTNRLDLSYSSSPAQGHYFVIKGYIEVDHQVYFQVYDPLCWDKLYTDQYLIGRDRYYRATDVYNSCLHRWANAFVVGAKGQTVNL